jgi:hypothetical protein
MMFIRPLALMLSGLSTDGGPSRIARPVYPIQFGIVT